MPQNVNGEALPVTGQALAEQLRRTSEWRRERAEEHPDSRNDEAADLLESLAHSVEDLDHDDDMAPLNDAAAAVDDYVCTERTNDYIGRIGFDHFPDNALALVGELAGLML